ncbi:MAG TPA: dihydroneopterin triphosphate diphosphatase [Blastocatellia bacterium]|jgi:dATP pyrophosphohydrolase
MSYKQPRSVQVVIFAESESGREYLLLRRIADHGGFWQFVTGSLEECEAHLQAAAREVFEETGIVCSESDLIDIGLINTFEISPLWLKKYAPGVTHNEEVCFALRVEKRPIRLDPVEHTEYGWVDYDSAMKMLYWESNRKALDATQKMI